jgi:hypothetical protein
MKIFDNGLIQGDNWYIARSNGAVDGFTPAVNNVQPTGVFKVLRSGSIDDWITLEAKIRTKLSKSIQSSTLDDMIKTMKKSGDDGLDLALKIENGFCESIDGYTDLIKKSSSNEGTLKAVKQALDKAYELVQNGTNKSMLRFEDNPLGYDVDLGIRTAPGSNTYSVAYQFKTNTQALSSNSVQKAAGQLYGAPTQKRILELKLFPGDNLEIIKSDTKIVAELEKILHHKQFYSPPNNVLINEVDLIFSTGQRVKVIYKDCNLHYLSF